MTSSRSPVAIASFIKSEPNFVSPIAVAIAEISVGIIPVNKPNDIAPTTPVRDLTGLLIKSFFAFFTFWSKAVVPKIWTMC